MGGGWLKSRGPEHLVSWPLHKTAIATVVAGDITVICSSLLVLLCSIACCLVYICCLYLSVEMTRLCRVGIVNLQSFVRTRCCFDLARRFHSKIRLNGGRFLLGDPYFLSLVCMQVSCAELKLLSDRLGFRFCACACKFFATSTTGSCIAQRSSVTVVAPARYERGGQRREDFCNGGIIISFYGFEMENNLSSKIKIT